MQHPLSCSSLVQIKSSTLAVRIHPLTLLLSAVLSLHPYSLSLNTFYFSLSLRSSRPLHNLFLISPLSSPLNLCPSLIPSQPLSLSHPLSPFLPLTSFPLALLPFSLPLSSQISQVFVFQPPSETRLVHRLKTISALEGLYVTGAYRHVQCTSCDEFALFDYPMLLYSSHKS
jgi:hypothetical protein